MRYAFVAAGALLLLAAGCGGVESEPNLAKAVERTEATGSARLELRARESEGGETFQGTCDGIFDYAGKRSRLVCDFQDAGKFEIVELGNVTYSRFEELAAGDTQPWARMPTDQESALSSVSPESLLTLLRSASRGTERLGEEEVRGVASVRFRMTVDCDQAEIGDCQGESAPVDVWIDGDGLVRKIEVDDARITATIEFFEFGVKVDIEAPPADQVSEDGTGWAGTGPSPGGSEPPCSEGDGAPISKEEALGALRSHGFSVRIDNCVGGSGVVAGFTNSDDTGDALARQGLVFCHLRKSAMAGAPKTVVRRGVDGGDAELLLANLTCMILADSPKAEEKIRPLEQAFEELERAIRP